jgi:hypothetical protein
MNDLYILCLACKVTKLHFAPHPPHCLDKKRNKKHKTVAPPPTPLTHTSFSVLSYHFLSFLTRNPLNFPSSSGSALSILVSALIFPANVATALAGSCGRLIEDFGIYNPVSS